MAKTRSQRPERARAIALPPTPANASMITVFSFGADSAMCAAILLSFVRYTLRLKKESCLLGYRLRGDAKPCVLRHPDAFIIFVPDLEALEPVSDRYQSYLFDIFLLRAYFCKCAGN